MPNDLALLATTFSILLLCSISLTSAQSITQLAKMSPPSHNTNPQIRILPATTADIPTLADIHVAAFQSDLAVQLMFTDPQQRLAVTSMLEAQIPGADSTVVKAIDPTNGDILGWQACVYMNDDDDGDDGDTSSSTTSSESQAKNGNVTDLDGIADAGMRKQQQQQQQIQTQTQTQNDSNNNNNNSTCPTTSPADTTTTTAVNPALRTLISRHGAAARQQFMRGRGRFLLLNSLVVSPGRQHGGVGSSLVRWAAATADHERLPCWLQSSPVAAGVYAGAGGFRGVRDWEVDLSEYAPGGKGAMRGWGVYRFRYMVRDAAVGIGSSSSPSSEGV